MLNGLTRRTIALRWSAALLLLLGVAQLSLIVAAVARVIDPGPGTFDVVGALAGLGVALGIVMTAWTTDSPRRPPALGAIGLVLLSRAIVEARHLVGILFPGPPTNPGSSSGLEGIFIGVLVLGGIVVLAFWEIALGRWMLGAPRQRASPVSIS